MSSISAMTDPDRGAWSYTYNILGEIIRQQDAKGLVTCYSHDTLGRIIARKEGTTGTCSAMPVVARWTFDSATNDIGQLAQAETLQAGAVVHNQTFSYDSLSRPTSRFTRKVLDMHSLRTPVHTAITS